MTHRSDALARYLIEVRDSVDAPDAGAVVIGSEAADLDSMVSTILYARLLAARRAPGEPLPVPVINCSREDFGLRTEAVYLFSALGIDLDALLFRDEIDLERLQRTGRLRLTLVDHNVLCEEQAGYADAVAAIVDHHADGGLYPDAEPRVIEPVGSATTLVAEAMLRDEPDLVDPAIATLLLGTILLDTVRLDPAAGRATPRDEVVAAGLVERAGADPDELFVRLETAKFDVSSLGTGELLRKDHKAWDAPAGRYGMSTVLLPLADWVARDPDLAAGLDGFRRARALICLVVMAAYTDADHAFRRELGLCARDAELAARLTALLEAEDPGLERLRVPGWTDGDRAVFFAQGDTSISRKKLQPLLQRCFSERADD